MPGGLKLGILRLGRVAGKSKYALFDEQDIKTVQQYAVEPKLDVDRNGNGARIYAIAHEIGVSREQGRYLHEILWEKHVGGIAPGYMVVHKNNVTVDNRLDNLELVKDDGRSPHLQYEKLESMTKNRERSLYWQTVTQLLNDPVEHTYHHTLRWFDRSADAMEIFGDSYMYYECHYPPCHHLEKELREFSICGRCQEVRYCGTSCQERDWPSHKKFCKERSKRTRESTPDR